MLGFYIHELWFNLLHGSLSCGVTKCSDRNSGSSVEILKVRILAAGRAIEVRAGPCIRIRSLGPGPFPLIVCGCGGKGLAKSLSAGKSWNAGAGVRM